MWNFTISWICDTFFITGALLIGFLAEITYDETELTCIVSFKDLNLCLSTNNDHLVCDYQAMFGVYDIGSTVIDGLLEMIEAEKNSLEA